MKANLLLKHWSGSWITRSSTELFSFDWHPDLSLRDTCHDLVDLSGVLLTVEHILPLSYYYLATGEIRLIFTGLIPPSAKVIGEQWDFDSLIEASKLERYFETAICNALWEYRGAFTQRNRMLGEYTWTKYGGPCKNSFTK